jgi:hypothetical protein
MAIDCGDDRNRTAIDGAKCAVEGIQETLLIGIPEGRHDLQVKAGAKGPALAGKDDGTDARIAGHAIKGLGEAFQELHAHGVRRRPL